MTTRTWRTTLIATGAALAASSLMVAGCGQKNAETTNTAAADSAAADSAATTTTTTTDTTGAMATGNMATPTDGMSGNAAMGGNMSTDSMSGNAATGGNSTSMGGNTGSGG